MTEALSQNLENNLDVAFEMLNVSTAVSGEIIQPDGEFSNLINIISANLEQAQTEFETLAADSVTLDTNIKSNISSINQFVLEDKTLEIESTLELDPDSLIFNGINLDEVKIDTENLNSNDDALNIEIKEQPELSVKEVEAKVLETVDVLNEPVQETTKESQEKANETTNEIVIANLDVLNQNKDLDKISSFVDSINNQTDEKIDSIEGLEEIDTAIKNVLSLIDETNLTDTQKTKFKDAFLKVQKLVKEASKELSENQQQVSDEAKKILDGIVLKLASNNKTDSIPTDKKEIQIDTEELKAIVKQAQMIEVSSDETLTEAMKEATDTLKEALDAVLNNDIEGLETALEGLNEASETLQGALLNNQETKPDEVVELNKKLLEAIKVLTDEIESDKTTNTASLEQLSDEIKPILENSKEFNIFEPQTKQKVLEVLNAYKESANLSADEKKQIENVIKQINNFETNNKTVLEVFKKENNSLALKELENILTPVDSKTSKTVSTENINTNNKAPKEQKSFIENVSDEMIVEAKLTKIPPISGALSVNDEVAKMALNEETSPVLSAVDTPIQSHVIYDNGVVKNNSIHQLKDIQAPKFNLEEHNVMNQITDKITELKGSQGHKLTLVLRPNDLGRVSIELKTDVNGLTTHIVAQNAEVRNFIEKNIHNLRQSLTDSGVNVNNIQIKTAGEAESSTYEGNKDSNQQQQQQEQGQNKNQNQNQNQNQKERRETLASFSDFQSQFKKDFSSVLNKTISYNLN